LVLKKLLIFVLCMGVLIFQPLFAKSNTDGSTCNDQFLEKMEVMYERSGRIEFVGRYSNNSWICTNFD